MVRLEAGERWKDIEQGLRDYVQSRDALCLAMHHSNPPTTPAGRWYVIDALLNPVFVDECGVEHKGEPMISREDALKLMFYWSGMATIGPVGVDANGAPV